MPNLPINRVQIGILAATCVLGLGLMLAPAGAAEAASREGGAIEIASVVLLFSGAAAAAFFSVRRRSWLWLSGALMMLWAVLRELDFQKRFTYRSIESTAYYFRDVAPPLEKVTVILILLPFIAAGLHLVWNLRAEILPALRRGEAWIGYLFAAFAMLVLAQAVEKILPVGSHLWEETFEAGLAAFLLGMIFSLAQRRAETEFHGSPPVDR